MRLRRLELVVIGVTLAFALFIGGFFTGRNWSAVNIVSVAAQIDDTQSVDVTLQLTVDPPQEQNNPSQATPGEGASDTSVNKKEPVPPSDTTGQPRGGDGRININLATQTELTDLPGIGSVLASRIVDYRRAHGDFQRIEDIRNVSGIGEKRYEAIQDKITVG